MRFLISSLFLFSFLFASSISMLLNKIEKTEDLSTKTMQESAGISYVITRYQLDMMQAKYLADVLKHTVIGYSENRYALTDPWNSAFVPYNTIGIRIFLDNQELTTAKYDNAMFLYGKIDLTFIDHIEIYYMSPTYELSPEPAYIIIKLYSKDAKRDEGTRVSASYGTFKSNSQVIDYAKAGKLNVYTHFSRDYIGHEKIAYKDTVLNRDSLAYHYLLSAYNDKTHYLLSAIYYKQHAFLGLSLDGNIDKSLVTTKYLHLGVDHYLSDNLFFKYSYDHTYDKSLFSEDNSPVFYAVNYNIPLYDIDIRGYGNVHTLELIYKKICPQNKFISGLSYRKKSMDFTKIKLNSFESDYDGIKSQNIYTGFLENNYQYLENAIFTAGFSFSFYDSKDDKKLKQYKVGNTFLFTQNDIVKLFYYHYEFGIPPYLVSTLYGITSDPKPQKTNVFIAKYKKLIKKTNSLEFIYMYAKHYNYLLYSQNGLESVENPMNMKIFNIRYHKNYNEINDFILDTSEMIFRDFPVKRMRRVIGLNTHRYKKFDFFESIVYKYMKFSDQTKDGVDFNLGVKYNVNDNLTVSLKGQNLLNKRYKNGYVTFDLNTLERDIIDTPLLERTVTFTMEYMF